MANAQRDYMVNRCIHKIATQLEWLYYRIDGHATICFLADVGHSWTKIMQNYGANAFDHDMDSYFQGRGAHDLFYEFHRPVQMVML